MFSLFDTEKPLNRRALLTVGGLGTGGLALSDLLALRAAAGTGKSPVTTGKSVVFLLQHGGPTQFETFDPKLTVPDGTRTVGGVAQTNIPGVTFGAALPRLSRLADRMAIVKSYTTGSASHSLRPLISEASRKANIGTLFSRLAGANHPESGMPTNVTLFPNSVDAEALGPDERFGKFNQTGEISSAYAAFAPGGGSDLQKNMQLELPADRFDDRSHLLASLDRLRQRIDASGAMEGLDRYRQQAYEMVLRGVAKAFDLSQEDPATLARYDTGQFIRENADNDKTNGRVGRRWYQTNAQTLGKQMLLARLQQRRCDSWPGSCHRTL